MNPLSTRAVADQLGMSPRWVCRQVAEGRLAARAIGIGARPTLRYDQTDVDRFVLRYVSERGRPTDEAAE